jgi:hypothetical protein
MKSYEDDDESSCTLINRLPSVAGPTRAINGDQLRRSSELNDSRLPES